MKTFRAGMQSLLIPLGAHAFGLFALVSGAHASPVDVTVAIQRVKNCCDNVGTGEPFFRHKIPVQGIDHKSTVYENLGSDGSFHTINDMFTFRTDSDLGVVSLEIEQWDDDQVFNGADDHIDSTAGPGDDVFINLNMKTFTWVGQNADFCDGPRSLLGGCTAGRTERGDHGGFEWTITFTPIEVCDGIDNDGNTLIDDGTGSCLQRFAFVPTCWGGTQAQFDDAAFAQLDFFLSASNLTSCGNNFHVEVLPLAAGFCPVEPPGQDKFACSSAIIAGVRPALVSAGFNPDDFDMIVGATDQDKCQEIKGAAGATLWTETSGAAMVLAHEFGHAFIGLGEEYCAEAAGGGNAGVVCNSNASINFLGGDLGCNPDTPNGGTCCNLSVREDPTGIPADQPCSGRFGRCCLGNLATANPPSDLSNNTAGARCIMSFASAPGPRGWCKRCWDALQGAGLSCNSVFGGAGPRLEIAGLLLDDGILRIDAFDEGVGRVGFRTPLPDTPFAVEVRDSTNATVSIVGMQLNHGFADGEIGYGGEVWLRIPIGASFFGTAMSIVVVRTSDGSPVSQVTINGGPPVADAGEDQTAECAAGVGTFMLDAGGSTDPDGDSLSYKWIASAGAVLSAPDAATTEAILPLGTHVITLEVNDGLDVSTDTVTVSVEDTLDPSFTAVPSDVLVTDCSSPSIGTAQAMDQCGVASVASNAPALLGLGDTTVTWTVTDLGGNSVSDTQLVTTALRDDASCCPSGTNVIHGTPNRDNLDGTSGSDCILGHGGIGAFGHGDDIEGKGGNDYIAGGAGEDDLEGDDGNDRIWGWEGGDAMYGENGNDSLYGGFGEDHVHGGDEADSCFGQEGDDHIHGDSGPDLIEGGTGDDDLHGDSGNDTIDGGAGYDECYDGTGTDVELSCEDT